MTARGIFTNTTMKNTGKTTFQVWLMRSIVILFCILACFLAWSLLQLGDSVIFPISQVDIKGNFSRSQRKTLKNIINPFARKGFFDVDLKKTQTEIQSLPGISQVQIKRVWPNRLIITASSEHAVANWSNGKLLNNYGEIFYAKSLKTSVENLPKFLGSENSTIKILDNYQKMSRILQLLGRKIKVIALSSVGSWFIKLDNGMTLQLGQNDVLNKLSRFVKVYHKVFKTSLAAKFKKVDLRYAHGMAVR